ncbi:MAG: tyrosine--tRNA ligase, partial [Phycisphaerales bacterium]
MQKNGFLDELTWRGLLHQTTSPELAAHLGSGARSGYAGFDPTSDSLTIGNFMGIKLLAHLQRAGHRPIVVSGGGTGLIGDPSGKSAERQLLTRELVEHNVRSQQRIFDRFLEFNGTNGAVIRNNIDWLSDMSYLDMLRDIGKHFSVNQMIARDSVASRLEGREQGISYTEFSYMILQAYDFLHLHRTMGCTVQLGGADQWGNIVSGIDLVRRVAHGEAYGITNPLVTQADGGKFGKSARGAG